MLQLNLSFPSGRNETATIPQSFTVADLKTLAQKSFRQGFLRLVADEGQMLTDLSQPLQAAGIEDGDHLTAVAQQPRVTRTNSAFAVWCCGGDGIVTWGDPEWGGDSSGVQDQLKNVQQVQATCAAFAAILADGSVITWGTPTWGGDSSAVRDQLKNVQHIQATDYAFAHLGSWICCYVGRSTTWWGQLRCSRSTHQCQANSGQRRSLCCHFGRSNSCFLAMG